MGYEARASVIYGISILDWIKGNEVLKAAFIEEEGADVEIPHALKTVFENNNVSLGFDTKSGSYVACYIACDNWEGGYACINAHDFGSDFDEVSLPTPAALKKMDTQLQNVIKAIVAEYKVAKPKLKGGLIVSVSFS